MKNFSEQSNHYYYKQYQDKYQYNEHQNDPDWQFKKVQSIFQVAKQSHRNVNQRNQPYNNNDIYQKYNFQKTNYQAKQAIYEKDFNNYKTINENYQLKGQKQNLIQNPSFKSNSETNILSNNQSLQYLSSQQPSFSNKSQLTVLRDFDLDNVSPVKRQIKKPLYIHQNINHMHEDWQLASFSSKNNNTKQNLQHKCMKLFQFVQQLKFMKQGLQSKLKQQKVLFTNQIQQLKKLLFKLNIKYQKQILEFSKNQNKPLPRQISIKQSRVNNQGMQKELIELKGYCQRLQDQKKKSQQKYQITLRKYQQQIQLISYEFQKKLALQRSSHIHHNQQVDLVCYNCQKLQQQKQDNKGLSSYEIEIWKNKLKQQQQNHAKGMKRLQQKVYILQQQFQALQNSKIQIQKTLKQKQKQILYRQAQIQYKIKDIQKRQRDLQMAQSIFNKQKQQLQKKKQKIADYQLKVLKQERKQKNQIKQKQMMTSQYFNNCQKRRILSKGNSQLQRSDSLSSRGSKIDINARLRQIQMMKNRGQRNYDQNINSRNSSKDSRTSGYKDYASSRVSINSRNGKDYGINPPMPPQKDYGRQNDQTIKLSQKLNKLTQTLQKQLRQMD